MNQFFFSFLKNMTVRYYFLFKPDTSFVLQLPQTFLTAHCTPFQVQTFPIFSWKFFGNHLAGAKKLFYAYKRHYFWHFSVVGSKFCIFIKGNKVPKDFLLSGNST